MGDFSGFPVARPAALSLSFLQSTDTWEANAAAAGWAGVVPGVSRAGWAGTGVVVGLPGIWLPLSPGLQLLVAPGPARHPDPFPGMASPQGTVPARFLGCPGQGGHATPASRALAGLGGKAPSRM